jgi:hypothetical protein
MEDVSGDESKFNLDILNQKFDERVAHKAEDFETKNQLQEQIV